MPIRPDLRPLYRTPDYRAQRARVAERSGNTCEQCGKPNGRQVWVFSSEISGQFWTSMLSPIRQAWTYCLFGAGGNFHLTLAQIRAHRRDGRLRRIRVVCTMAHLDHNPANNSDENTQFLCQWCHLNYDKLHHKDTRSARKDAARPLLNCEGDR